MYRQMYRYVRGQIEAGIYGVGGELPPAEQLERQFAGSTPNDARQAYFQLVSEGMVDARDGRFVVSAATPPPVQTVAAAVDRIDALEASLNETLVALRGLRSDLAGVQTPRCGQWWQVRSLALGADPIETSHAVCIHDRESDERQWLVCVSNTWVRKPLHYFQPLRRLTHISDWSSEDEDAGNPVEADLEHRQQAGGAPTAAMAIGAAYYSTDDQHDAHANFELYGPEQWTEGFFS